MGSSRGTTVSCGLFRVITEKHTHTHTLITATDYYHYQLKLTFLKDTKSNMSSIKIQLTASNEQKKTKRNKLLTLFVAKDVSVFELCYLVSL